MFITHYFIDSPEGTLILQIYYNGYIFENWYLGNRKMLHDLVVSLSQADKEINPECYPENQWSPNLSKAVIDALK